MCITLLHPDLRFFIRNIGDPLAVLRVEALFTDAVGINRAVTFATVAGGAGWAPTLPLPFGANAFATLSATGTTAVAFRFTALGGAFQIDDIYVDPYVSR
jgi:hypothetical protein